MKTKDRKHESEMIGLSISKKCNLFKCLILLPGLATAIISMGEKAYRVIEKEALIAMWVVHIFLF